MRIISVVPSFTELLFDLGLESQIVGITRFCIHPVQKTKAMTKIGGTKSLKIERIISLKPNLVIANKEENSQADIEELSKYCTVWVTEIHTLQDALDVIIELGERTNTLNKAQKMVRKIRTEFANLRTRISSSTKNVAYLIWEKPMMLAGRNTFINALISELNWVNILEDENSRYPEISEKKLTALNPDLILLSSEPFPFKEKHRKNYLQKFPKSKIILVDGEMFSWYGSRLLLAPKYFEQLHNEVEFI